MLKNYERYNKRMRNDKIVSLNNYDDSTALTTYKALFQVPCQFTATLASAYWELLFSHFVDEETGNTEKFSNLSLP